MLRFLKLFAPLLVLAGALTLALANPFLIEKLRSDVFDTFQRLAPRNYEPVPVRIIDIDDASLERLGQWPWPRDLVAKLVDQLSELGASVIAFDIVFAEPDRTSPANMLGRWPALDPQLERLPDHDQLLAEALAGRPVVLGFALSKQTGGRTVQPKAGFAWGGPDPRLFLPDLPGRIASLSSLEAAAAGSGSFSLSEDGDGIDRRVPLLVRSGDALLPSLSIEALRVALGASTYVVRSVGASGARSFGDSNGVEKIKVGKLAVPTDGQGRIWIHYSEPHPERFVPAWRVLNRSADRSLIEGHVVFVGTSAAGLGDLRATPIHPAMPGVLIHAQATEQMLLQHQLSRPDWAQGAEIIYMLLLGGGVFLLQRKLGPVGGAFVGLGTVTIAVAASWWAYMEWHWLIDPVLPSISALSIYLVMSLLNYLQSETRRREIRNAFSQYVSPDFVQELVEHPDRLVLGGERKRLTILFADLRDFTTISERYRNPEELIHLINRFLTPMSDLVMSRRGTIDKYMGDCVMAFWNAPIEDAEHARHGCESALAMLSGLERLNLELSEEASSDGREFTPLRMGIGLNTGDCCVGNMGSDQRFDYSAIGDAVNFSSRLEGQSKTYGVNIVIGDNTQSAIDGFATIELDRIQVKGKLQAVAIHALLGDQALAECTEFLELSETHQQMLNAFRGQRWGEAAACVSACRNTSTGLNRLYDLYAKRIAEYAERSPPPDWDGVYIATSK